MPADDWQSPYRMPCDNMQRAWHFAIMLAPIVRMIVIDEWQEIDTLKIRRAVAFASMMLIVA